MPRKRRGLLIALFMISAMLLFERTGRTTDNKELIAGSELLLSLAARSNSDKFYRKHYTNAYLKYLVPLIGKRLKILEIGLGCGMPRGAGASLDFWKGLFQERLEMHVIEYDKSCVKTFQQLAKYKFANIFAADQSNITELSTFVDRFGDNFDIIVDDGGHTMEQQIKSIQFLFPYLKPGGSYFLEDMETSLAPTSAEFGTANVTTLTLIKMMLDRLAFFDEYAKGWNITRAPMGLLDESQINSMECFNTLCVFNKA